MLRVYVASRFHRAPAWRSLAALAQFHPTSRWLTHHANGVEETPDNSNIFWQGNIDDILHADCLLAYVTPDDKLGGALVEIGIALANDIPVYLCGDNDVCRSWVYHPLIFRGTMQQCLTKIKADFSKYRKTGASAEFMQIPQKEYLARWPFLMADESSLNKTEIGLLYPHLQRHGQHVVSSAARVE